MPKKSKARKERDPRQPGALMPQRAGSKESFVVEMLRRPEGATLAEIMATTGWQAHSVRGAIAGGIKKKLGLFVVSAKERGERRYRIVE